MTDPLDLAHDLLVRQPFVVDALRALARGRTTFRDPDTFDLRCTHDALVDAALAADLAAAACRDEHLRLADSLGAIGSAIATAKPETAAATIDRLVHLTHGARLALAAAEPALAVVPVQGGR